MMISPGFVGIDVSKSHLDLFDGASGLAQRIANEEDAIAAHAARWRAQASFVLFEATGRYDARLRRTLSRHAVPFARVNPGQARHFAQAAGFLAKTDAVDARMLAAMAQALRPAPHAPRCPDRDRLTRLARRRDQLVACRAQERTRRTEANGDEDGADIARHIAWLSAEIRDLDTRIARLIAANATLRQGARRLRSAPGIGPVAAAILLALMPELGSRSPKTIAALAGLAPLNNDSGRWHGQRTIRGGRRRVRSALYMATLAAKRLCPRFQRQYDAMVGAGKPPKVALIAIARKLLLSLNAMQRDQKTFAY
ncbi:MAG: IS110 family transposase [Phycisphaerales bacterium]